MRIKNSSLVK